MTLLDSTFKGNIFQTNTLDVNKFLPSIFIF